MITIRRILCPVDLSDTSLRALQHASALALWYEATLTALFVDTTLPIENVADFEDVAFSPTMTVEAQQSSHAIQDVRHFVSRISSANPIDVVVEASAHVERAILHAAAKLPADLIVMGAHGRSGIGHALIGSVTERVLRSAPCPVMVVPPHDAVPTSAVLWKHIVCAVDFSETSRSAVAWAMSLAEEADARLSLLHVIEVPPELRVSVVEGRDLDALRAAFEADALTRLRSMIPAHATEFCSVETATVTGGAGHAILSFARQQNADLIVMGAQGHGALERFVFGSKTRDVARGAACPVLTARQ